MADPQDEDLEPGSQAWWRNRKQVSRSASRENLAEVSEYVSGDKEQGPKYHQLVRQITSDYKSDIRVHRVAAARASLGAIGGISDHLAFCNSMLEAWCDIRMLSPDGLLKWKATLLREMELGMEFARGVADGPAAIPPEVDTVEIEVTTPEERASYAAKLTVYKLLDVKRRAMKSGEPPIEDAELAEESGSGGASASE